jgi:uncharacterized protein (TIGR01655 family)
MKKIFGLLFFIAVVMLGFFGYHYYQETYVGETAYAQVPDAVPEKIEHESKSGIGNNAPWYSYDYNLRFVKEDGRVEKQSYQVSGDDEKPLEPGTYIKVKMSKKRVLEGPTYISEQELPDKVKEKLK